MRRKLFSSQPLPTLHVFTAFQPCKIDRCLSKNSQNSQDVTFNLGCKKFTRRKIFSSPAISHVTRLLRRPNHARTAVTWSNSVKTHNLPRLIWAAKSSCGANFFHPSHFPRYTILRRPNHAKLIVACPKTVKTHNLPRLNWAAKSSRGANFFHPSHFPRYTSFTASQLRKNDRWLAKNSQNSQIATFNLGCKKFARREIFSSPAISHVTRLLRRPNHAKMAVAWPKSVKTHNLPRLIWPAKSSPCTNFFHPSHFPRYTFLRRPNHAKLIVSCPKTVKTHNLPRLIWAAKSSRGATFFHPQPFPTLHVSYGVPTTQEWPLPGQTQSKHTIYHV